VFVETQFQHDPDFHARWFSELFLYLYRRPPRRAWRAVTVFPNRTAEGVTEPAYELLLTHLWVKRVYLKEALREPTPSRSLRVLGLILALPATVVADARALLAEKTGLSVAEVRRL
jgi:predicted transposase YdaD